MAFSAGTYSLPGAALNTGDTVSATENNTLRNDMASSFNLTWLRNGTAAATANIPMGTYKFTGLGNGTASGDSIAYGQTADAVIYGLTVGRGAGAVATNTAVGSSALAANTSGAQNTAIGWQAGNANTTGGNLTAVGRAAANSNTTGAENSAFGVNALQLNTTGANNTAIGSQALINNTTASNNTAVGYQAGYTNSTGTQNSSFGSGALYTVSTGNYNAAFGYQSANLSTGSNNTFYGAYSGSLITTGQKNTIIGCYNGNQNGLDIRTASNYIVLADGDGNPRGVFDSSGYFLVGKTTSSSSGVGSVFTPSGAFQSSVTGTAFAYHALFYNNGGSSNVGAITSTGSTTSYTTSSDYRLKENIEPMTDALAKVAALNPVTYSWKADGSNGQGFIAHELQAVIPDCVTGEKDAVDADGKPVYQGIDVSFLVGTLTAAIQELNAKVDAQAAEIAALKGQA
jgi:trimeric autotransporter adhesin